MKKPEEGEGPKKMAESRTWDIEAGNKFLDSHLDSATLYCHVHCTIIPRQDPKRANRRVQADGSGTYRNG